MTIQEAIMIIQSIPEKIWNQMSETENEAIETVVKAFEKQVAKKPKIKRFFFIINMECPNCKKRGVYVGKRVLSKYCPECGLKLEWSED